MILKDIKKILIFETLFHSWNYPNTSLKQNGHYWKRSPEKKVMN